MYKETDLGNFDLTCIAAKFSPRGKFVGASFYDGTKGVIKIYDVGREEVAWDFPLGETGRNIYNCITWRPQTIDEGAILLAVDTEGCITKFNSETGEKTEIATEYKSS